MDFNSYLKLMAHKKASDLFITANLPPSIKIHGRVVPITQSPLSKAQAKDLVLGIMSPSQKEVFERTHECNFAIGVAAVGRFRVSAFYQRTAVGMVIRRVETKIPTFEALNLPEILQELSLTKRGIMIFVGGTGTGKSTSLAALIGYRNVNTTGHIITIEDPIEFVHSHKRSIVTQREVGVDTDTYDTALKNTLRQAPNVILIGEIRAKETMEHAIAFAETGHLCLSTLHSNNTNQTLDRIINFFPADQHAHILMDLSLNLRAIVSQRLIPKIGGGLIAAVEVLINTPRISELILKGKVSEIKQLMQNSQALGMQTFDQSLFKLHEDGIVTYEDALRAADSANDLRLNIKLNSKRPIPSDTANGEIAEETQFQLKTDPNESGN